jgi:23S rRNA (cytosine1962-C5)-methyltransferase
LYLPNSILSLMQNLIIPPTEGYELIDSGNGLRLERFGTRTVVRPDPSVLWAPTTPQHPAWINPDARFMDVDGDRWKLRKGELAEGWDIAFGRMKAHVKLTPFRHVGIFPEQAPNWDWIQERCKRAVRTGSKIKVLNLFGYTGMASIAAALSGAMVTHVDASKSSVYWASENAKASGLTDAIRWIVEDVQKFVAREIRRGAKYDLIIMDPPVFGRGTKGEIWRLEQDLPGLLNQVSKLVSNEFSGFLLNTYATPLYPESMLRIAEQALGGKAGDLKLFALCLEESESKKLLQSGYAVRS